MKIAQIAPLWESVPPETYGGTELVAHLLTEELVRRGHEVTLFATGDSRTTARLESSTPHPLRLKVETGTLTRDLAIIYELSLIERLLKQAESFDIIHNHMGFPMLAFAKYTTTPILTTLHGTFAPSVLKNFIVAHGDLPYVSISDAQRKPCPQLNYLKTIYHGIPVESYAPSFAYNDKNYLAFLGRLCAEKGVHHAIRIAHETGWPLVLAGKIDDVDKCYFSEAIEPYIDGINIHYIGEVNHAQKVILLQNAAATLCPVTWPEPFGLVLIESMACGTPVLALNQGSIPEIVSNGKTGFVCDTVGQLIEAVPGITEIDRRVCRHEVEARFSVSRMVDEYVTLYRLMIEKARPIYIHEGALKSCNVPPQSLQMP